MKDLTAKLNALCDEHDSDATWYFKDLKSGDIADRDGDDGPARPAPARSRS